MIRDKGMGDYLRNVIIMTSHERHGDPTIRELARFFFNFHAAHDWSFVREIQWWQVDSHHKGPVMPKGCAGHDFVCYHVVGVDSRWSNMCSRNTITSSNGNFFPRYWPFVRGIHRSSVNSPLKGQWRGALMFPFICGWANNLEVGDLRRHRANYDITVMIIGK